MHRNWIREQEGVSYKVGVKQRDAFVALLLLEARHEEP